MAIETFKEELYNAFTLYNDENDITFLIELLYYFPIDKTYIATGSYDQYLYDLEKTVIDNYESGNFQVSYFYAHLVFMSYVYYCVEKAYQIQPDRMKDIFYPINSYHGRDDKPDIENYSNVYEFSKIPEKDIFKVFHILGMDDPTIKTFSKYITSRDDFAHATGKGNISEEELVSNIRTISGNMATLHNLFRSSLEELYVKFILDRLECDFEVVNENYNDLVFDSELSINDLEFLCHLGVRRLQDKNETLRENYQATRNIHCGFIEYCMENDGISEPSGYVSLRNQKYLYYKYKDKADEYIENELKISAYECAKDGGEFPLYECPDCDEDQLVYDVNSEKYHCFHCGADFTTSDISFCSECGEIMRNNESCICDACFELKIDKD